MTKAHPVVTSSVVTSPPQLPSQTVGFNVRHLASEGLLAMDGSFAFDICLTAVCALFIII